MTLLMRRGCRRRYLRFIFARRSAASLLLAARRIVRRVRPSLIPLKMYDNYKQIIYALHPTASPICDVRLGLAECLVTDEKLTPARAGS